MNYIRLRLIWLYGICSHIRSYISLSEYMIVIMQNDKHNNASLNWNNIVNQEARTVGDDADLGRIKGLFDQFIVTERGTINKEKFYIPKSLIRSYDGEILRFNITEQEAKNAFMHDEPPSDEESKQMQAITERLVASRKELTETLISASTNVDRKEVSEVRPWKNEKLDEMKQETQLDAKSKYNNDRVTAVIKKGEEIKENLAVTTTDITKHISMPKIDEELLEKIKLAASEFKHMLVSGAKVAKSGAKVAKQKIEEKQKLEAEKQTQKDAEKISKMGSLATELTNSFNNVLLEIETRPYAEQVQIYKGLLKLMNQQRKLVKAREDLATKLKGSVLRPIHNKSRNAAEDSSLGRNEEDQKQKQLPKEPVLSMPEPQLPELNIANTTDLNNNNN
jgi:hypothetical protein